MTGKQRFDRLDGVYNSAAWVYQNTGTENPATCYGPIVDSMLPDSSVEDGTRVDTKEELLPSPLEPNFP